MTPFLQLVFVLMVIVLAAKIASFISTRLGQPSVLGELIIGIILGPSLLNLTHLPFLSSEHLTETVIELGEIGVLLLMFIAGLELHVAELARNTKVSGLSGTLGVVIPVAMGYGTGLLFGFEPSNALFLGLVLGATSVSISAQTLMELNVLRTRVGLGLLGAAVFDDVLVIVLLSSVLALSSGGGGLVSILIIFLRILLYLAGSVLLGLYVLPWLIRKASRLNISQPAVSTALVVMLLYSLTAELVGGMAAITGSFIAGLMLGRTPEKPRIEPGVRALSYSLFVPIFFISIGLGINLREVPPTALVLMLVISLVAIVGKIVGCGLGAKVGGFSWRESIQLGAGMVSRGEVGLIVASIGIAQGQVTPEELSAIVGMVIITTLVTPPMLRALFKGSEKSTGSAVKVLEEEETADVHGHVHS